MLPIPLSVSLAAGIRWNPEGSELTYVNRGKDGDDIWGFRIGDGTLHQITHFHGVKLISFDWSPDGEQWSSVEVAKTVMSCLSRTQDRNRSIQIKPEERLCRAISKSLAAQDHQNPWRLPHEEAAMKCQTKSVDRRQSPSYP
jgi:hypothetical protein